MIKELWLLYFPKLEGTASRLAACQWSHKKQGAWHGTLRVAGEGVSAIQIAGRSLSLWAGWDSFDTDASYHSTWLFGKNADSCSKWLGCEVNAVVLLGLFLSF